MKSYIIALASLVILASCKHDPVYEVATLDESLLKAIAQGSPNNDYKYFILPETGDYKNLPNQDPHNPITKEKIDLGKLLFFETGLAQTPKYPTCYETYSCSSCHVPSRGFLPGRAQGIADGAVGYGTDGSNRKMAAGYLESEIDAQGNRPMTVMNVTYMTNTLWSGLFGANDRNVGTESSWTGLADVNHTGYAGLEAQNIEGFKLHRLAINDKVLYEFGYAKMFDAAFPDLPLDKRYTPETASFAMGAYLRSILTNEAPFQKYLKGNPGAIPDKQKKGALLFFGKAGCISCHDSPSFSSMNFFKVGTKDMHEYGGLNTEDGDARTRGRGMFTGRAEDDYTFKVPQLYNLKDYVTFFHGSSKMSIKEVVEFKLKAKSENKYVSDSEMAIIPRNLTEEEKEQLIEFLTYSLYDDYMTRYMPSSILSGYCFPNNDEQSHQDTGCR